MKPEAEVAGGPGNDATDSTGAVPDVSLENPFVEIPSEELLNSAPFKSGRVRELVPKPTLPSGCGFPKDVAKVVDLGPLELSPSLLASWAFSGVGSDAPISVG